MITSIIPVLALPETVDRYLASRFTYFTQDQWQKEIEEGKISINDSVITEPAARIRGGEKLSYDGSSIVEPAVDDAITLLHEEAGWIAVNKTGNLPVHPSGRYFNHTLTAMLEERYGRKVYPVHRIDRETSGVVLLAFDGAGAHALARALAEGTKEYLALVHGNFPDEDLKIDLPLGRDTESKVKKKRRAWPGGDEKAVTRFRKVLSLRDISLVRCFPETGKLHQIRAHLQSVGFPIVGDKLYGRDETAFLTFVQHGLTDALRSRLILPRSALHAARLVFRHPQTHNAVKIRAPLPGMFTDLIRFLRDGAGPK